MSLFRRNETWWIDFTTPSGERVRRSAQTTVKAEAKELHDQLKAAAWRVQVAGDKPRRTWDEAALKWLDERHGHKKTLSEDETKMRWLQPHLSKKYLDEISRDTVMRIGQLKRAEASEATANRMLALVRAILRKCEKDWDWLVKAPQVTLFPEAKRRVRWLTPEQAQTLLRELPQHQRDTVLFALSTGLRQGNVLNLKWSEVNLAQKIAWIHGDEAKAKSDIHVSLNAVALDVLTRQIGKHQEFVFTYKGNPLSTANTRAWRSALVRAGIERFRWHDLRHSWASWLVQNGTPAYALQEMGGWKSGEMVRRYAHLSPANMAEHAAKIDEALKFDPLRGTNLAQALKEKGPSVC